ncbi:[protein-PII] uridylyltransferase [Epidermidibacterium keratini]
MYDDWLRTLVPPDAPVALVAVGGLGREEVAPYSDIDLVLLHDLPARKVREVADSIWYPIWDSGIGLDHAVRTVADTARLAASDVKVALGLLDVRYIAGDRALADDARAQIAAAWRQNAARRAEQLQQMAIERAEAFGHVAYLLEPNLKQSYGGLRDATILRAMARAQLIDIRPDVRSALSLLLDVRGEVQRQTGKSHDVLRASYRDAVGERLGLDDGPELLRRVTGAGRVIAHASDTAFRRAATQRSEAGVSLRERLRRPSPRLAVRREGLAKDVVAQNGEVVLAREARPGADRGLVLRVARAAAYADLPISTFTLERLRIESATQIPLWSDEMRADFDALLAAGRPMLRVWESLDQHGLLERLLPEWAAVRSRVQHNAVHTYTVDRHLLETVLQLDALDVAVSRPDILRVAALLHDIGKGRGGDHSVVGADIASEVAMRMGFAAGDVETIDTLVRQHLLLANTATRRDLGDPLTIEAVRDRIDGSVATLELLHALTVADAQATGPAAWSRWKADLVAELVRRVARALSGEPVAEAAIADEFVDDVVSGLDDSFAVAIGRAPGAYQRVVVALRDERLGLAQVAGVLSIASLDVRRARIAVHRDSRVLDFMVEPRFGAMPPVDELSASLYRVADGSLDVTERLARKAAAYDEPVTDALHLSWYDGAATDASVLEVRAGDRLALLHALTDGLARAGVEVVSAVVETYGRTVIDSFYLRGSGGGPLDKRTKLAVERTLHAVLD